MGHALFTRFICLSSKQRDILVNEVGVPAEKISVLYNPTDAKFFSPPEQCAAVSQRSYAFACGMQDRDYEVLKAAARLVSFPFEVVASGYNGTIADALHGVSNIKVYDRRLTYVELRRLYAEARFVVVPLLPVEHAGGATSLLEGMAMGQAVIVTNSPGISDYLEGGVGAIVVPPHNPRALAQAVSELWADPGRCEDMGRRNRAWVEQRGLFRGYVEKTSAFMRTARQRSLEAVYGN
jgi:glycosyltransferase involved in cell wall biosynthesis